MKSKLKKFKEFEIEKSQLKNINGSQVWYCWTHDIQGSAMVTKPFQVKAFRARGYFCDEPRYKAMNVTG